MAKLNEQAQQRLEERQRQLGQLTQEIAGCKKKSDIAKLQTEIAHQERLISDLSAFLALKVGERVTDGKQLGAIANLSLSQGGLPEVWVSWHGAVEIPEQPLRLISEPILDQSLKIGDIITVNGCEVEIKEFLGNGKVRTEDGSVVEIEGNSLVETEVMVEGELTSDEAKEITFEPLSPEEEQERLELERQVEQAFYLAGMALKRLRDGRFYRSTHPNFESYSRDRFGNSRQRANYLIAAAEVYNNLTTIGCQNQEKAQLTTTTLPTNERQVRPLAKLTPEAQVQAWTEAVEVAGQRVPTAKIVSEVVKKRTEIPKYAPNPFREGDVVEIIVKGNPDLRGRGGQWAIVDEIMEHSCIIKVWDGVIQVKTENLKDLSLPSEQREAVKAIAQRCHRLIEIEDLDSTARGVLELLSKKTWLNEIEKAILERIEDFYLEF